jgi:hypothetical protein
MLLATIWGLRNCIYSFISRVAQLSIIVYNLLPTPKSAISDAAKWVFARTCAAYDIFITRHYIIAFDVYAKAANRHKMVPSTGLLSPL